MHILFAVILNPFNGLWYQEGVVIGLWNNISRMWKLTLGQAQTIQRNLKKHKSDINVISDKK